MDKEELKKQFYAHVDELRVSYGEKKLEWADMGDIAVWMKELAANGEPSEVKHFIADALLVRLLRIQSASAGVSVESILDNYAQIGKWYS
jgi:hypothetical protein